MRVEPPATASPRVKCLLVDDLEENLLALSALLRRDDVELLTARSGREALELLLVHDVALALLDVQMPEMDGFELAELMRGSARTRHVPLIFVTAGARDQHRLFKGYDTGAVDFLFKPIEPHVLKSKADVFFQLHRQKQQLARELQERTETLRLNELFTAVLGHDLRGPLSAITMSAHVMQRRSNDEVVQKAAGRMLASAGWMSRMIGDLLDLARARLGSGLALKRERTDLGGVVQTVVQERCTAHPDRRIEVEQAGDLAGDWDADRLTQVLSNLVGNAVQHGTPDEPVQIHIDGTEAAAVSLAVSNAGCIPPELLPHIFDPFRGKATEVGGPSEGLGLGLYIVQQIVLAHGGRIEVESGDAQQRTVFRISLPREAG